MTHVNLNDGCCEGMRHRTLPALSIQYHPEAAPGPHDADPLFAEFVAADGRDVRARAQGALNPMPKRTDIHTILIIGAGPIVIGQAAEFDYSGTQAVKALKAEGYRVVLVNSNPATIMTDPELADATYIEPLTPEILELIIDQERPDALLPTVGGQTGLNAAVTLAESGVLERYGVAADRRQLCTRCSWPKIACCSARR